MLLACGLLAGCEFCVAADGRAGGGDAAPEAAVDTTSGELPRFGAFRRPDAVAETGPYAVEVERLSAHRVVGGEVRYSVVPPQGEERHGVAALQRAGTDRWRGEIPPQPDGSLVRYHFALVVAAADDRSSEGEAGGGPPVEVLHPRRAPQASFRFRVRSSAVAWIAVPRWASSASPTPVRTALRGAGELTVRLRYRILPDAAFAATVDLRPADASGDGLRLFSGELPALHTGQVADLHLEVLRRGRIVARHPEDAPLRFLTIGAPRLETRQLTTGEAQVDAVVRAVAGGTGWLFAGLRGGGLLFADDGGAPERWTFANGLESGLISRLQYDPSRRTLYVGAAPGGVQQLSLESRPEPSWLDLVSGVRFGHADEPHLGGLTASGGVDQLELSPLTGELLIQHLERVGADLMDEPGPAQTLLLRDGRLADASGWISQGLAGRTVSRITATAFDESRGCWLLGVLATGRPMPGRPGYDPFLVRRCGDATAEAWPVPEALVAGGRAEILGIEALAALDELELPLVALRHAAPPDSGRVFESTVFRWHPDAGLEPLDARILRLDARVTAMAVDRARGEVAIGTDGAGLMLWRANAVEYVGTAKGLPSDDVRDIALDRGTPADEAASSKVANEGDAAPSRWLVATSGGLARLGRRGAVGVWSEGLLPGVRQADLRLWDHDADRGRWLARYGDDGVAVLELDPAAGLRVVADRSPASGLPRGPYGAASFGPDDAIYVARLGDTRAEPGLLRIDRNGEWSLLNEDDGIRGSPIALVGRDVDDRLLWLGIAATPFTRSPGLQLYDPSVPSEKSYTMLRATFGETLLRVPESREVFLSADVGVFSARSDGTVDRIADHTVRWPLARGADGTVVAVAEGNQTLAPWDPERRRFGRLQYRSEDPPRAASGARRTAARDGNGLAIDSRRRLWHRLGDVLTTIRPEAAPCSEALRDRLCAQHTAEVRDVDDGLPPTARRLHLDPSTGRLLISSREGLWSLKLLASGVEAALAERAEAHAAD